MEIHLNRIKKIFLLCALWPVTALAQTGGFTMGVQRPRAEPPPAPVEEALPEDQQEKEAAPPAPRKKTHRRGAMENYFPGTRESAAQCTLENGQARFRTEKSGTEWRPFASVSFTLRQGENQDIPFKSLGKERLQSTAYVIFRGDSRLVFCENAAAARNYTACRSIPAGAGYDGPFSIPGVVEGTTLTCTYSTRWR